MTFGFNLNQVLLSVSTAWSTSIITRNWLPADRATTPGTYIDDSNTGLVMSRTAA
jgi:hypothetical protein